MTSTAHPDTQERRAADRRPAPADRDAQQRRKTRVLTHGRAAASTSIADALVVKHGEPFFLCPPDGQIELDGDHGFGLYHHDTRYLSGYLLHVAGKRPHPLASSAAAGGSAVLELTNPDLDTHKGRIHAESLAIRWSRCLADGGLTLDDELHIENQSATRLAFEVTIALACDFRDVFDVRGLLKKRPGKIRPPEWQADDRLVMAYDGADGITRRLEARFDPAPDWHDRDNGGAPTARYRLTMPPRGSTSLRLSMEIHEQHGDADEDGGGRAETSHGGRAGEAASAGSWIGGLGSGTELRSDSLLLTEAMTRSLTDLALLRGTLDGCAYYEAGIPWFGALFGRDSLISALQTLAFDANAAADTLRLLAARQGTRDDAWRDEEPGRILHELRVGELAHLGEIPHTPFYGTVDATPLFLILLARHATWTGSLDLFAELRENVDQALGWIDANEDRNGGYVAYRSATGSGLVNQGWKDSGNGIVRADGNLPDPPIALVEVQGYVYRARNEVADLFERDGHADRAQRLRNDAEALRQRFERDFWSDALGAYVLALARDREPCEVLTSNTGQVLWSGIASPERARKVAGRLTSDEMFSGWGVRTLSSKARAYSPIGYHLGTVWPHDNGLIADGLRRYGCHDEAERIFVALVEAAGDFRHRRLPECMAGYSRSEYEVPVRYPVACHPQAWAAGSIPHLLTASLDLEADGFGPELRIAAPKLPRFIPRVELRNLRVGREHAHLAFERRSDGGVRVEVMDATGGLNVQVAASKATAGARARVPRGKGSRS